MRVGDTQVEAYTALTNAPRSRQADRNTASAPVALQAFLRFELDDGQGTPEFRAWVQRAARRLAVA